MTNIPSYLDVSFEAKTETVEADIGDEDFAGGITVDASGRILVAGTAGEVNGNINSNYQDFALIRYNKNGSLDTTFDGDGIVTTHFLGSDYGYRVIVDNSNSDSNGKILVVGDTYNQPNDYDFALARYNNDGTLDTAFGGDGKVTTDFFSAYDTSRTVAVQKNDGKVLVGGLINGFNGDDNLSSFGIARYNNNGTLDTTFDRDGKVVTDFFNNHDEVNDITIDNQGKILVAGWTEVTSDNNQIDYGADLAVARYNSDGSLDTTFDGDGKVNTDFFNNNEFGYSTAIQNDGKILVAGYANNGENDDFIVVRYNKNGSLDTTFDGDGKVTTDFFGEDDQAYNLTIDSKGKILLAGPVNNGNSFGIVRYNSNGSLDTSFDGDGKYSFITGNNRYIHTHFQGDNTIFVTGDNGHNIVTARLVIGTAGTDQLVGTAGDDSIFGYQGNDTLKALAGNDIVSGGVGKDLLSGGSGNDTLLGEAGSDVLDGNDGNDVIWGDQLVITAIRTGKPSPGNDLIRGGRGNDKLWGQGGHDTLIGGYGSDGIDGGEGNDLLIGDGDNTLGNDTLSGGPGKDKFMIGRYGEDRILDFTSGQQDEIVLSRAEFGLALPVNQNLPASNFVQVINRAKADVQYRNTDKIVLITNNNNLDQLYYKGDIIATLGENSNVPIASDFLIVD